MNDDARAIVDALGLAAHPEGGFYRETFRAPLVVGAPQGPRAASTAIYYLLAAGSFSTFHRVRSDEAWHHYDGDALEGCTVIDDGGVHAVQRLGRELAREEQPQIVVGVQGCGKPPWQRGPGSRSADAPSRRGSTSPTSRCRRATC